MGRNKLADETAQVTFKLPKNLKAEFYERCKAFKTVPAETLRYLINQWLYETKFKDFEKRLYSEKPLDYST